MLRHFGPGPGAGSNAQGGTQTLFSVEVTAKDKVGEGGGLVEEGEMITVVERSVEEVEEYLAQDQVTLHDGDM